MDMSIDWETCGITLNIGGRVRCEPNWRLDRQWSKRLKDYDLWLIWAGRGKIQVNDQVVDLHPGVCLWMRPGSLYLADHDSDHRLGATFQHFELYDAETTQPPPPQQLPPQIGAMSDYAYADAVLRRIRDLRREDPHSLIAKQLFRSLLMDFGSGPTRHLSGTDRQHHDVAAQTAMAMDTSPDQSWDIRRLADEAGYSPDHFTRIFKNHFGQTPQAYAAAARIARAKQLLAESSMNISQVAAALGYRDVYYFSRQFTQHVGTGPRAYRQAL